MSLRCDDRLIPTPTAAYASVLQEQFRTSPYLALRQLTCDLDAAHDRVIVRGALPSYYLKQVAQAVAIKAVGVGGIASEISVETSELDRAWWE